MGNHHSEVPLTTDLIDSSYSTTDHLFKVDNINSHGRKHSSAKIQITHDDLCIRQKHRQSLHIPLDTIRRYGLDGSIFILECGRRAPLGQARYAFRCKHARRLVDCLDQRINIASTQLFPGELERMSPSTLTNVSSTFDHHRHATTRRRTQSEFGQSPSSRSLSSATSFYRNSEPDLSENYFAFDALAHSADEAEPPASMNYVAFPSDSTAVAAALPEPVSATKSYVYIDHEKTHALKDIAQERSQHHTRRIEV